MTSEGRPFWRREDIYVPATYIVLREDGTFDNDRADGSFRGKWHIEGSEIVFEQRSSDNRNAGPKRRAAIENNGAAFVLDKPDPRLPAITKNMSFGFVRDRSSR